MNCSLVTRFDIFNKVKPLINSSIISIVSSSLSEYNNLLFKKVFLTKDFTLLYSNCVEVEKEKGDKALQSCD